jgi:hypothetical protein
MKPDLSQTIQTLANLGVLAGIIFLAFEIRQNTAMTRAQITQSRADTAVAFAEAYFNSDYLPVIREKVIQGEALSVEDVERYDGYLRAALRNQDNNLQQYRQGLLSDNIPRNARLVALALLLDDSHGLSYWERSKSTFSDEFIEFVDQVLDEAGSTR